MSHAPNDRRRPAARLARAAMAAALAVWLVGPFVATSGAQAAARAESIASASGAAGHEGGIHTAGEFDSTGISYSEWRWLIGLLFAPDAPAPVPVPIPAPDPTPSPDPVPVPVVVPAPSPIPALPSVPAPQPSSIFADAGVPGASNTGVPAGTLLTVYKGDLTIDTPGTVISGLDIHGLVTIAAPDVTIMNSIVRGRALNGPRALIDNLGGHANLKIIDTELYPSIPSPDVQGIYGFNFVATRLNIHGVVDGIHLTGGNVEITDSWLHDNLHFQHDPNQAGTPSHDDSIQIQEGTNIRIDGNKFSGAWNATVQVTQDRGDVSNLSFTNNTADGGKCSINLAEKKFGPIRGVVITDNVFGRNTRVDDCAVIAQPSTRVTLERNFYTPDDEPVTVHPG